MEEGKKAPVGSQHAEKVTVPVGGLGRGDTSTTAALQPTTALISLKPQDNRTIVWERVSPWTLGDM